MLKVPPTTEPLAARVATALKRVREIAEAFFVDALASASAEAERMLFQRAANVTGASAERALLDSARAVRRANAEILPRFLNGLDTRLAAAPARAADVPPPERLDLIATHDLERKLLLDEAAERAQARTAPALDALDHRFAVLWCAPLAGPAHLPLAPLALNAELLAALADQDLAHDAELALLRAWDGFALARLDGLLEAVNEALADSGVLPTFAGAGMPRRAAPERATPDDKTPKASNAQSRARPDPVEARATQNVRVPTGGDAAIAAERLLDAWAARADHDRWFAPEGRESVVIGRSDLHTLLSQRELPLSPAVSSGANARVARRSGDAPRRLLAEAGRTLATGAVPRFEARDAAALDIMDAFLSDFAREFAASPVIGSMLGQLEAPLFRLALDEPTFFVDDAHPARRMLDDLVALDRDLFDEDPDGRRLLEQLAEATSWIGTGLGGANAVDAIASDVRRHLDSVERRARVAERRHIDAARGRERLALAERAVGDALSDKLLKRPAGELLRVTLEEAWRDVLALTWLRYGEDSEPYRKRFAVVDRLLALAAGDGAALGDRAALRDEIESGLALLGYPLGEIHATLTRLLGAEGLASNDGDAYLLAVRLRARPRLGEPRGSAADAGSAGAVPLNAADAEALAALRALPLGTWLRAGAGATQRKLAWRSETLGVVLLINRRATVAEERSELDVARDLKRGVLSLMPAREAVRVAAVIDRVLVSPSSAARFHA